MTDRNNKLIKPKHKLRAMTNAEFCKKWRRKYHACRFENKKNCPLFQYQGCCNSKKPCRINGKYILIEEKE